MPLNVFYTNSLPMHWIIEDDLGLWIVPPSNMGDRTRPYRGHRAALIEAHTKVDMGVQVGHTVVESSSLIPRRGQPA